MVHFKLAMQNSIQSDNEYFTTDLEIEVVLEFLQTIYSNYGTE